MLPQIPKKQAPCTYMALTGKVDHDRCTICCTGRGIIGNNSRSRPIQVVTHSWNSRALQLYLQNAWPFFLFSARTRNHLFLANSDFSSILPTLLVRGLPLKLEADPSTSATICTNCINCTKTKNPKIWNGLKFLKRPSILLIWHDTLESRKS